MGFRAPRLPSSYVDSCSSDTTVDFSDAARIDTRNLHPSLTKGSSIKNTLASRTIARPMSLRLNADHQKASAVFTIQEFFQTKNFSCLYTFVDVFFGLYLRNFKPNAMLSLVRWVKSALELLHMMSRSLGATLFTTVPSMEHSPSL